MPEVAQVIANGGRRPGPKARAEGARRRRPRKFWPFWTSLTHFPRKNYIPGGRAPSAHRLTAPAAGAFGALRTAPPLPPGGRLRRIHPYSQLTPTVPECGVSASAGFGALHLHGMSIVNTPMILQAAHTQSLSLVNIKDKSAWKKEKRDFWFFGRRAQGAGCGVRGAGDTTQPLLSSVFACSVTCLHFNWGERRGAALVDRESRHTIGKRRHWQVRRVSGEV